MIVQPPLYIIPDSTTEELVIPVPHNARFHEKLVNSDYCGFQVMHENGKETYWTNY